MLGETDLSNSLRAILKGGPGGPGVVGRKESLAPAGLRGVQFDMWYIYGILWIMLYVSYIYIYIHIVIISSCIYIYIYVIIYIYILIIYIYMGDIS